MEPARQSRQLASSCAAQSFPAAASTWEAVAFARAATDPSSTLAAANALLCNSSTINARIRAANVRLMRD
jgi:hypothetical protein